jgi:phosphoribosylaminoimidazole carboxylase (NCAIR synthetase)
VDSAADLARAVETIGAPGILKTRRDGYDGKGQWRIMAPADAQGLDLPAVPLIYEGFVHFFGEFSVILVRGQDGEVRFWDRRRTSTRAASSPAPPCPLRPPSPRKCPPRATWLPKWRRRSITWAC